MRLWQYWILRTVLCVYSFLALMYLCSGIIFLHCSFHDLHFDELKYRYIENIKWTWLHDGPEVIWVNFLFVILDLKMNIRLADVCLVLLFYNNYPGRVFFFLTAYLTYISLFNLKCISMGFCINWGSRVCYITWCGQRKLLNFTGPVFFSVKWESCLLVWSILVKIRDDICNNIIPLHRDGDMYEKQKCSEEKLGKKISWS